MPVEIYKVLHIFGILLLFSGLAGLWGVMFANKGTKKPAGYGPLMGLHGLALVIILISGMGMAGKLGYMAHLPGWLGAKMVIWLLFGGSVALIKRKANWGAGLLVGLTILGSLSAYLAIFKPF